MNPKSILITCLLALLAPLFCLSEEPETWNRFRGPNGSGVIDSHGLPIEFGPAKNVVWKTALPTGYSSPVLSRDRIYLTGFEGDDLLTMALDRTTG